MYFFHSRILSKVANRRFGNAWRSIDEEHETCTSDAKALPKCLDRLIEAPVTMAAKFRRNAGVCMRYYTHNIHDDQAFLCMRSGLEVQVDFYRFIVTKCYLPLPLGDRLSNIHDLRTVRDVLLDESSQTKNSHSFAVSASYY